MTAAGIHGETGLDGANLPEPRARAIDTHAADLLDEMIEPGVVLVPTGPLTNVALALSRWVDVISARVFKHETVVELAAHASVPVINALSDREHPIQAFADLMTLQEQKGELGNNLKLAYIGDGNNVLHALLLACAKTGVNLSAACPDGYLPDPEYVRLAEEADVLGIG